jgi:hypothetical protein
MVPRRDIEAVRGLFKGENAENTRDRTEHFTKCVADTYGWIAWLTDGQLADVFAPFLIDSANLVVPTLVQYELYQISCWCLRERDEVAILTIIDWACRNLPGKIT